MMDAGVPTIPGSALAVNTVKEGLELADIATYPVMIKASLGGGGKGMRVARSAEEMKLTADDMLRLGIVEKVISEPENLTRSNISDVTNQIASDLAKFIEENLEFDGDALCEERYKRYRKYCA